MEPAAPAPDASDASDDWAQLLQLLDAALDLPPAQRNDWLDTLRPPLQRHRTALQRMIRRIELGSDPGGRTDDRYPRFLNTLPKMLDDAHPPFAPGDTSDGPPQTVGDYRLLRELGHGGMGSVWLAERIDGVPKRTVALKLPHAGPATPALVERFARERDILASLEHPHIARLYDAGVTAGGQPYLAMEVVDGQPINAYCDEHALGLAKRIVLMMQVLQAVQHAHAHLVVHRDLKPGNILVTGEGQVRLLDFGIAKLIADGAAQETALTRLGGRAMTLDYASPEQIEGRPITTSSDVYSLGVLLYELLTGARPYRLAGGSSAALQAAILDAEPPRLSVAATDEAQARLRGAGARGLARALRGDLDTIVLKALKKRPEERYATAEAMREDLQRHLDGEPVLARPDSAAYRLRKFVARQRVVVTASAVVVLALLSATAVSVRQARVAQQQTRTAEAVQSFLEDIFKANSAAQPDPTRARQTTARELLDLGAGQIDRALSDAPEAQLQVLKMLTDLYDDLDLQSQVIELAGKRVRLAREVHGPRDLTLADALIELAFVQNNAGDTDAANAAEAEAARILDANPHAPTRLRARLETAMAAGESHSSEEAAAQRRHIEHAVALLSGGPPTLDLLSALQVKSNVMDRQGDAAASIAALSQAIAATEAMGGQARAGLPDLYRSLGQAQAQQGAGAEAEASYRKALQVAQANVGESTPEILNASNDLGSLLRDSGRLRESLDVFDAAQKLALELVAKGNLTPVMPMTFRRQGTALTQFGRIEQGRESLRQAETLSNRLKVSDYHRWGLLEREAENAIERGDFDTARTQLAESQAIQQRLGDDHVPAADSGVTLRTREALASGRPDTSAQALKDFQLADDAKPDSRLRLLKDELSAEVQLAAGDAAGAAALASSVRDRVRASPQQPTLRELQADADEVLGQAQRKAGHAADALAPLKEAVALRAALYDPLASPRLADAQVALASCLLDLGDRAPAQALFDQASAIHAVHPQLGDQYRRPLRELQARLAYKAVSGAPHASRRCSASIARALRQMRCTVRSVTPSSVAISRSS